MKNFFKKLKHKIGLYYIQPSEYNGTYPSVKNDIIQSLSVRHHGENPKLLVHNFFISFLTYYQAEQHTKLLYEIVEDLYPEYLNLLNTIMVLK
jgi:hypothetical protein